MSDLTQLYGRAVEEFADRVRAVGPDDWKRSTPCTEWDVRDLVNHLVGENRWTPPLLDGKTIDEVGNRFDGDLLGDDPHATWQEAAEEAIAAVGQAGALGRVVHVSFGDISGEEYVTQLTTDHVVHAWDLARAIGGDERLDPELVEFVYGYLEPRVDGWRAAGAFGPDVQAVPPEADRQARLLALTGRQP